MDNGMPSINFMPAIAPPARGASTRQILRVWRRHIRLFLTCFGSVLVIGIGVLLMLKPTYTATAIAVIAQPDSDPLAPSTTPQAGTTDDDLPTTEASMMQSRDVAAAVLKQFPPVAAKPSFSIKASLCHVGLSFLCRAALPADPEAAQQAEIDVFLNSLSVLPVLHSRVINVSVTSNTGPQAANLADAVVTNFQRIALAEQTDDVNRVASWLDGRTADLQNRWLNAVNTANAYSVSHNLTNTTQTGTPNPLVDSQMADMATSLSAAQATLAAAQAQADALHDATKHGDTSALVTLSEQPILVAAANNLMMLENSRNQLAAEFGPDYPKIVALDSEISETRAMLNSQTKAALGSIDESLVSSRAEVQQLTANLNQLKSQAGSESAAQAQYLSLIDEANSARTIYENFLEHENDIVDRAALLEPPVILVSHASIPNRPTFPNKPKLALGIFVIALAAGIGATFAKDYLTEGFEEAGDLQASVPVPLLASLPVISPQAHSSIANYVFTSPFSAAGEAVRGLVTKLALLSSNSIKPRAILVASAVALEGKSTLTVWLATAVRQGGQSVLVIDGDHRRGSLMPNTSGVAKLGLTDLLIGRVPVTQLIQTDPNTKIDYIPAGAAMVRPFGPEEIARFQAAIAILKQSYSLIVIDSPPLLAMTDALVYGSIADQTILVCRWQQTSRMAVNASLDRLRAYGARIAGLVVTMADENSTLAVGGEYGKRETQMLSRLYGYGG